MQNGSREETAPESEQQQETEREGNLEVLETVVRTGSQHFASFDGIDKGQW